MGGGGGEGGNSHMKRSGCLSSHLRGINQGFSSHDEMPLFLAVSYCLACTQINSNEKILLFPFIGLISTSLLSMVYKAQALFLISGW